MGTCTFTDGQWVGMGHGDPMEVVERWGSWRSFPNSVILGFCVCLGHVGSTRSHSLVWDLLVEGEEKKEEVEEEGWESP